MYYAYFYYNIEIFRMTEKCKSKKKRKQRV